MSLKLDGLGQKSHGVPQEEQKSESSRQRARVKKAVKGRETPRFPERGSLEGGRVQILQEAQYSSRSPRRKENISVVPLATREIERIQSFKIPVRLPEKIGFPQGFQEVLGRQKWIPISTATGHAYFDVKKLPESEQGVFKNEAEVPNRLLQKTVSNNTHELRKILLKREKEEGLKWTVVTKEEVQQAETEAEKQEIRNRVKVAKAHRKQHEEQKQETQQQLKHFYRLVQKAKKPSFEELHRQHAREQAEASDTAIRSGLFGPEGADNE